MQIPYLNEFVYFLIPAVAVICSLFHHRRVLRGHVPALRPLAGIDALERRLREIVETGRPVQVATGSNHSGTLGPSAETIASLHLAQRIAEAATRQGGNITVMSGDAVADLAARGTVHATYQQTSFAADYGDHKPQLVAHQSPVAYAAGNVQRMLRQPPDTVVMAGNYGSEALLIGMEDATRHLPQIAAATSLSALPGLALSTQATLVGEELFAAEAYLADTAAPKARLMTQDALRWCVVLLIILGIVYQISNSQFALGLPAL